MPEIEILLHRMLWPVWQVRWESARRLAELIAGGDLEAAKGLLDWIAERCLESEASIGLSVIDAFQLGPHFEGSAVRSAVKVPSHLSNALLRRLFGIESDGGYGFAKGSPNVNEHVAAYFHKKMGQAIPLSFQSTLKFLEDRSGLPFLDRWEYEWQWLQGHLQETLSSHPHWFSWEDHGGRGHFDLRQREVYLSAFLRTLAFATASGWLNNEIAEGMAMEVYPLDRSLAGFTYRERPVWTQGLATSDQRPEALADLVWKSARQELANDRALLSMRAVDISGQTFKEIEVDLVASPGSWSLPDDREDWSPLKRTWLRPRDRQSGFTGPLVEESKAPEPPYPLTVVATPWDYARWHLDLFPEHLQIANPAMFDGSVSIESRPDGLGLTHTEVDLSSTRIWNTSWAPTKPSGLESRIGRTTDVRRSDLESFLALQGLQTRRLAYVRIGSRKHDYGDFQVDRIVLWLDPEAVV